jgi:hypothetical protein
MSGPPRVGSNLGSEKPCGSDGTEEDPDCTTATKEIQNKLFDTVQKRYEFELQRSKDLDTKGGNLIGYVSVVTGLILGLGTFGLLGKLTEMKYFALYFGGVAALAASIGFALYAAKATKFEFRPDYDVVKDYLSAPSGRILNYCQFIRELTQDMTLAFTANSVTNDNKGNRILVSWLCLIVGIILLFSYVVAFSLEHEIISDPGPKIVSAMDNNTIRELISGMDINIQPNETFNVNSPVYPKTDLPWMEVQYQWLKPNLTAYVIVDSSGNTTEYEDIASRAINEWVQLLRANSDYSAEWNINVHNISDDNLIVYRTHPPDIMISLFDDLDSERCSDYFGEAEQFRDDNFPQYAEIFTACGDEYLPAESVYNSVLHEFAHLLGLGHAHTKDIDLLCSVDKYRKKTCPTLPPDTTRPSLLNIKALISIYGEDGFGGHNRVLINKPYYVLPSNQSGNLGPIRAS